MQPIRTNWYTNGPKSIVGDQYPMPDRILKYTENSSTGLPEIRKMCKRANPRKVKFDLFATEGGNSRDVLCIRLAGRKISCYTKGDSIALMVPIFTPYTKIPE